MKTLKINLVLLTLLSIASGIAKIIQLPEEMEFFGNAGFSDTLIIVFGVAQLAGGLLLIFPKTRIFGAIIMAIIFSLSTALIFMSGKIAFGLFSILPVLMTLVVVFFKTDK